MIDAEKFLLNACHLPKKYQISIKDSIISRIRLDLVLVLIQQNRNKEATDLCRKTLSMILLNLAQIRSNLCDIDLDN